MVAWWQKTIQIQGGEPTHLDKNTFILPAQYSNITSLPAVQKNKNNFNGFFIAIRK